MNSTSAAGVGPSSSSFSAASNSPGATSRIGALVNRGCEAVLAGNADVTRVIAVPERASFWQSLKLALSLLRRYRLAISTLSSDRAHILAFLAAPRRAGVVPLPGQPGARW